MQIFQALRLRPQTPMPPAAGGFACGPPAYSGLGLCPQAPKTALHCEFLDTRLATLDCL